jgi:transcriptional regulator with XRE-family HTH domain
MLIQKLRLQRGWSQEQLAELSGLSVRTIQRLERGQGASVESLKALGAAFGIDFSQLKEPDMNTAAEMPANPAAPDAAIPSQGLSAEEALALAHVRKLKGFYFHLMIYCIVIGFLAIVNLMTSHHYLWFLWSASGWGIGLVIHGVRVFDKIPFLSGEWERRQVEKQLGHKL